MFFITTSTLMEVQFAFFLKFGMNVLMFLLSISIRHSYLLTAKTTSDINNPLIFTCCERATIGKSLQVS